MAGRLLPPPGLPRQLVVQSGVVAVGWGVYLTGSIVFFTVYVGLPAIQIGIGLSIAGLLAAVLSLPFGHLADRIGGKRTWIIGSVIGILAFLAYPLVGAFWSFLLVLGMQTVSQAMNEAGRVVYTAAAVPRETRVRTMAYARAYLNAGFTIGAGVGAAAIAVESRAGLVALMLINAAGITVGTLFLARMPDVREPAAASPPRRWGVLRDHPFIVLAGLLAVLMLNEMLFLTIMPLWAITRTDAPKPVLGALFAFNTIMAVLLQVPATRSADTTPGSTRLARWAALATVVACPVLLLTGRTRGWITVAVLALAVVLLTATELWTSAALWHFTTDLPPAGQRGAYAGATHTLINLAKVVGPVSLTYLAVHTGGWGWWVIAALFAACALAIGPVTAWVTRTPRNGQPQPHSASSLGHPGGG